MVGNGTDSSVWVTLTGEQGVADEMQLQSTKPDGDFEPSSVRQGGRGQRAGAGGGGGGGGAGGGGGGWTGPCLQTHGIPNHVYLYFRMHYS